MKFTQTAASFIFITFLFSIPSRLDFSEAFIQVAEKGNPAVVSIVSENNYLATSTFVISLSEFNIELPKLLFASIDNNIRIQVKLLIENH